MTERLPIICGRCEATFGSALLCEKHRAVDALLAVAKAAKANSGHCCGEGDSEETRDRLLADLAALDAAHPEWRTWTP